jgi:hypothetical protein
MHLTVPASATYWLKPVLVETLSLIYSTPCCASLFACPWSRLNVELLRLVKTKDDVAASIITIAESAIKASIKVEPFGLFIASKNRSSLKFIAYFGQREQSPKFDELLQEGGIMKGTPGQKYEYPCSLHVVQLGTGVTVGVGVVIGVGVMVAVGEGVLVGLWVGVLVNTGGFVAVGTVVAVATGISVGVANRKYNGL